MSLNVKTPGFNSDWAAMETWGSPETLSVSPQEGGEIFILIADSGCYMAETNTALSSNYLLTKTEEKRERERGTEHWEDRGRQEGLPGFTAISVGALPGGEAEPFNSRSIF